VGRLSTGDDLAETSPRFGLPAIRRAAVAASVAWGRSSSPAEFGKFIAEEIEKWSKVIKFAGIKTE
jgi:hypothetical protein